MGTECTIPRQAQPRQNLSIVTGKWVRNPNPNWGNFGNSWLLGGGETDSSRDGTCGRLTRLQWMGWPTLNDTWAYKSDTETVSILPLLVLVQSSVLLWFCSMQLWLQELIHLSTLDLSPKANCQLFERSFHPKAEDSPMFHVRIRGAFCHLVMENGTLSMFLTLSQLYGLHEGQIRWSPALFPDLDDSILFLSTIWYESSYTQRALGFASSGLSSLGSPHVSSPVPSKQACDGV